MIKKRGLFGWRNIFRRPSEWIYGMDNYLQNTLEIAVIVGITCIAVAGGIGFIIGYFLK